MLDGVRAPPAYTLDTNAVHAHLGEESPLDSISAFASSIDAIAITDPDRGDLAHDVNRGRCMREQCSSRRVTSSSRHVILVARDGVVLERALEGRDWLVTHLETGRAFESWLDPDVILLMLDDDELDVFETLMRLSAMKNRPPVVLLTRLADARALGPSVLESLGVDRLVSWPSRADKIEAELVAAAGTKEPLRFVS
jgi:CheY-like chemotaxis protein